MQQEQATGAKRVLLVRLPPFLGYKNHHPRDVTLPLTLAYIGTMARNAGWDARILDVWSTQQTMTDVIAQIRAYGPAVIIFEGHAPAFPIVSKCAEAIRRTSETRIAVFGSVPTFMPGRAVGPNSPIDVALAGECEDTALDLLDAVESCRPLSDVAGIAYWDDQRNKVCRTAPRTPSDDLDALPMIDYEMLDLDLYRKYSFPVPIHRKVRWGHILATRGCPYPCTHCSFDHRQSFGRTFRRHSPRRVVDEMQHLSTRYRINAISFEDDIFTMDRQYTLDVCDEIESRGVDMKWIVQTRVDRIDRELLKRMKRAGCVGVSLGIESGNDRVLSVLKKGFTCAQALEGIQMCQDEGLMMRLLFMIGNPTETAEEIEDTIDLVCHAKAITIQVHISTPYPGTGLLGEAEADGEHITDFTSYNKIVHNISAVPDEVLWKLQKKFYRKYFFSWRYFKVFMDQRVRYMTGSWRHDLPLILRAFWYLAWTSRQQGERDVEGTFEGVESTAPTARQAAADTTAAEPEVATSMRKTA